MRVDGFLSLSAARVPDKIALVADGRRFSYGELDRLASALAAGLAAHGITRGDRVLVFLDNCAEAVIALFALLKAGAVVSPVHISTKPNKLAYLIDNCRASAVITKTRLMRVLAEASAIAKTRPLSIIAGAKTQALTEALSFADLVASNASPPAPGPETDIAMLIYTSGSTGQSKGVMMSHANIDAAAASIATYLGNTENDVILNVLPLAFNYGLYQLLVTMRTGATLILEKSFAFPQAVFETMRAERVTGFALVPTIAALILGLRDLEPGFVPDLRYITNAAAALPPAHIDRLATLFPTTKIYSMYGQTECARGTYLPPERLADKTGSVGIAIPGTRAWVADEQGHKLRPGTIGELMISGPHVMQGYWENPEATARAIRPGAVPGENTLATGDLFYADTEGFLYFVGRKDDIIKTRGEKVAPKEIEAVILSHPSVAEAIVVGRDDPILGQAICALVVKADPALTEQDIIRHCARRLEDYMVPQSIVFRKTLPTTESGKLNRRLAAESLVQ